MLLAVAITLLAAAPDAEPLTAKAHLDRGLQLLKGSDLGGAHVELLEAFTQDPALPAPDDATLEQVRAEAIEALKTRLSTTAAKATQLFTPQLPKLETADVTPAPQPPELQRPQKERPLAAGGRLTVGAYGFYVIGESRGGPAPELHFGVNVGPVRLGGVASLMLGTSLGLLLGGRISTISQNKIAFLAAADLGVFYGGAQGLFAPYVTAHAAGVRFKAGAVGFEVHAVSLSVFWLGGTTFRFVPGAGFAILL